MTPCTALFWRALSRRSARRGSSLRCRSPEQRRGGCATCPPAVGGGLSDRGRVGFPECASPNRKTRALVIGYSNLKSSPSLAFTGEQLSSMIPKDFSKWKEVIVTHPPKQPLPEDAGPRVAQAPNQEGKRKLVSPAPQGGASTPSWEGGELRFSTVREGLTYLF